MMLYAGYLGKRIGGSPRAVDWTKTCVAGGAKSQSEVGGSPASPLSASLDCNIYVMEMAVLRLGSQMVACIEFAISSTRIARLHIRC